MGDVSACVKRILVVEDEPAIGGLWRRVLTEDEFELDIAGDGETAQEKIAEHEYSLLFIDMRLPKMSGEELYLWLVQEHPHLAGRVAFTTGSAIEGEPLAFLERSGRPRLFKPFGSDQLKAFVREVSGQVGK